MPYGYEIEYKKALIWITFILALSAVVIFANNGEVSDIISSHEELGNLRLEAPAEFEPGNTEVIKVVNGSGNPVESATVSIQSETIGESNSEGEIEFQTPESDFTVKVEKEGYEEIKKDYRVSEEADQDNNQDDDSDEDDQDQGNDDQDDGDQDNNQDDGSDEDDQGDEDQGGDSEPNAEIWIDEDYTNVDRDTLKLGFQIQGEASRFEIYANGEKEEDGAVEVFNTFTKTFSNPGEQNIVIKAFDNGQKAAEKERTFETGSPATATINWIGPDSADTTTPKTEFEVLTDTDYSLVYTINQGGDATEYSYWEENNLDQTTEKHTYTPDPLPEGTHDYNIEVSRDNEKIGGLEGTFETTEERGLVKLRSIEYSKPRDNHTISMELKAYEELEYDIEVDGRMPVRDKTISSTNVNAVSDIGDLTSGRNYVARIYFRSLETDKKQQEKLEFTAQ